MYTRRKTLLAVHRPHFKNSMMLIRDNGMLKCTISSEKCP